MRAANDPSEANGSLPIKTASPRDWLAGYNTTSTSSLSWMTSTTASELQTRTFETQGSVLTLEHYDDATPTEERAHQRKRVIPHEAYSNDGMEELLKDADFVRQQLEIMRQISERTSTHMNDSSTATEVQPKFPVPPPSSLYPVVSGQPSASTEAHYQSPAPAESSTPLMVPAVPANFTNNRTSSFQNDDYDFLRFLNDPALIEEQKRMLDQVEQRRNNQVMDQLDVHSTAFSRAIEQGTESRLEHTMSAASDSGYRVRNDELPSTPRPHSMLRAGNHDDKAASGEGTLDDRVVQSQNGKKVRVKGTKHAWKAVADGNAMLVQCPQCSCVLQVGSSAKRLYCTHCQGVSRIETCQLNLNSLTDQDHYQIARIVQQQELNVAYARKMTKVHCNSSS